MSSITFNKDLSINYEGQYSVTKLDQIIVYELIDCEVLSQFRNEINNSNSVVTENFTLKSNRKSINLLSYRYLKSLKEEELEILRSLDILNMKPYTLYSSLLNDLLNLDLISVEQLYLKDPSKLKLDIYFEWLNHFNNIVNVIYSLRDLVRTNLKLEEALNIPLAVNLQKKLTTDYNKIKKIYQYSTRDLIRLSLLTSLKLYVYENKYELKTSFPEYLLISKKLEENSVLDLDNSLRGILNETN